MGRRILLPSIAQSGVEGEPVGPKIGLNFDGSTYLTLTTADATFKNQKLMAIWFRTSESWTASELRIFMGVSDHQSSDPTTQEAMYIGMMGDGTIRYQMNSSGTSDRLFTTTNTYNDGVWHCAKASYNSGANEFFQLYIGNVEEDFTSGATSGHIDHFNAWIGAYYDGNFAFVGDLYNPWFASNFFDLGADQDLSDASIRARFVGADGCAPQPPVGSPDIYIPDLFLSGGPSGWETVQGNLQYGDPTIFGTLTSTDGPTEC